MAAKVVSCESSFGDKNEEKKNSWSKKIFVTRKNELRIRSEQRQGKYLEVVLCAKGVNSPAVEEK